MTRFKHWLLVLTVLFLVHGGTSAKTLRIGLSNDPDNLDPALARTAVSYVALAAVCDGLFEVTPDDQLAPKLATGYTLAEDGRTLTITLRQGVRFHDGELLDAAAVKYSIERLLTLPGSIWKTAYQSISSVEIINARTVVLHLSAPNAPLLLRIARLSVVSPKAAQAAGEKFGNHPVCAGPFKFVEHVAQDRVVVEKFGDYWNKDHVFLDRIVYRAIPDSAVRLANLRSGDLDLIEQVAATDVSGVRSEPGLRVMSILSTAYQGITINLNNGPRAKNPLGQDPRVREAFELALDRDEINRVVFNGEELPNNQWILPDSPYHVKTLPMPARDVAKAKALLQAAGQPNPVVTLMVPNIPERLQVAQVIQAMTKEAGFDVRVLASELTAGLQAMRKGDFEAFLLGFTGATPDPDSTVFIPLSCQGSFNDGKYCNPELDRLLDLGRTTLVPAERMKIYEQAASIVLNDRPIIYLYHIRWIWAYTASLSGFQPNPVGLIRATDLKLE
jgi:peptide/nickel transport system substrate-binding protein